MERVAPSAHIFRFGLFEADAIRGTLTRNDVRVKIQDQPFRLLVLLLERPGEVITREELRQKLWPEGTFVDFDGSLSATLKKLRAAIDDDSDNPRSLRLSPGADTASLPRCRLTSLRQHWRTQNQQRTPISPKPRDHAVEVSIMDRRFAILGTLRHPCKLIIRGIQALYPRGICASGIGGREARERKDDRNRWRNSLQDRPHCYEDINSRRVWTSDD